MSRREGLPARLRAGDAMTGVFQKFPHHQVTELLGASALDFAVLDTEHAPFDPAQLDACLLAARATDLPMFVRVASASSKHILAALDMGATGVFVPHVDSAARAADVARAARYAGGGRGFSPSTRAGGYGSRGLRNYMDAADRETVVVAQIEDARALDELDAIAGTRGVDALFVGRADLAASLGCDWDDPQLDEATRATAEAAARAGVACGAYLADASQATRFRGWGVGFLVAGSDQAALRDGANRIARDMAGAA